MIYICAKILRVCRKILDVRSQIFDMQTLKTIWHLRLDLFIVSVPSNFGIAKVCQNK